MGTLGWQETVFIFLLALLLFGPKKLPELGRTLGRAMSEFRRASNELKTTFDREMKSLEQETESLKQVANQYQYDTYNYDYSSYDESGYNASYGTETHDSTAANPSTSSASALLGAESPAALPEGTVAHHGTETAAEHPAPADSPASTHNAPESAPGDSQHGSTTADHNA
jgi:sec-independent protein translocase protein TatA